MIKVVGSVALVLLAVAFSFGRKEETLKELIARTEASRPDQQPDLYMEAADRQRKAAMEAMKAEHWEEFDADLQDIVSFCDKARAAAIGSTKHIKNTEIRIRRISNHLKDIKLDVALDDQPKVQVVVNKLEEFRTELLRRMFGGKGND
jgi:RecA/RadA recombinase